MYAVCGEVMCFESSLWGHMKLWGYIYTPQLEVGRNVTLGLRIIFHFSAHNLGILQFHLREDNSS